MDVENPVRNDKSWPELRKSIDYEFS